MKGMIRILIIVLIAGGIYGCQLLSHGTKKDMNDISLGMSKDEVVNTLGRPNATEAAGGTEILTYKRMESATSDWPTDYYVKIENDRVTSFGRADQDSGVSMKSNVTSNLNTNQKIIST